MRRRPLVALLLAAGCAAGCGTGPPQVTFAAAGVTVEAEPTRYCDLALAECDDDPAAPVRLTVPAGTPLRVTVPDEIAAAPWTVVFRYRDAAGKEDQARGPVLTRQEREYTLNLFAPTDLLLTAEVQQFGPAPRLDVQTGEVEFPVRGSWVLDGA